MTQEYDIIIVGGGPAGSSAAVRLASAELGLASRTLLLDKAVFPRPKLCGGGVVHEADRFLAYLGVDPNVPSVPIHELRFEFAGGSATHARSNAFRVVRRDDFDHALLQAAKARGVIVHEGERVLSFERDGAGIRVVSSQGSYHARVLIGADGANSAVRRALVSGKLPRRFVALDTLGPALPAGAGSSGNTAVFDFRPASRGIRGYFWEFPSLCDSTRRVNYGIGGDRWPHEASSLRDSFQSELQGRLDAPSDCVVQGSTIPTYDPRLSQSSRHVLLAGDAVGVDPWLGEGISIAIGTGILAAHAASQALATGDFAFESYGSTIRNSAVGDRLSRNRVIARSFYAGAAKPGGLAHWFTPEAMSA